MSLLKRHAGRRRHVGRRVAGVGVAAALMVIGLEAPAFAAPAISSFSPTSGPDGCVVVITGSGFTNPNVTDVEFGLGNDADDFAVISDTEIRAVAPGGSGFIIVTKGATGETASSAAEFTDTTGAGGCAPTITSFTPTCGVVGTTVAITGTNLLVDVAGPAGSLAGGLIEFSPFSAGGNGIDASPTGASVSPTALSVLVPSGAADGVISVTTAGGEVFSAAPGFDVVTDPTQCAPVTPPTHARSITLTLKKHLVARGVVSSTEDPAFTGCVAGVPVKIQRKTSGGWKNVGSATTTDTGSYKKKLNKDKPGKYRARATTLSLGDPVTDTCSQATSAKRTHKH